MSRHDRLKFLLKIKFIDLYFLYLKNYISFALYVISCFLCGLGLCKSGNTYLLKSIRISYSPIAIRRLKQLIQKGKINFADLAGPASNKSDALGRCIILSLPLFNRDHLIKGVILITYTHNFTFFLRHELFCEINKFFVFILEPSSAGYADPDILEFLEKADHCVIQCSEVKDRSLITSLFPQHISTSIGASDWVDGDVFKNTMTEKQYDFIYIANTSPVKRVISAIKHVKKATEINKDLNGLIICASWGGGDINLLEEYVEKYNLSGNIKIIKDVDQKKLVDLINCSKCSLLLSYKEGSNRVLFESILTDVPVICLAENIGVNKCYINEYTGMLVYDYSVPDALIYLSSNWDKFKPRAWAMQNIEAKVTTKKISNLLDNRWHDDVNSNLLMKVNSHEVMYKNRDVDHKAMNEILFGSTSENLQDNIKKIERLYFDKLSFT